MRRRDVVLAILSLAHGQSFSPVQIQKATFLVTRNLPDLVTEGERFNFVPYDYGPFDRAVYTEVEALRAVGLAGIGRNLTGQWDFYFATERGLRAGADLAGALSPGVRRYIEEVVEWTRKQDFASLVKSIYEAYPEMRANSIFQ